MSGLALSFVIKVQQTNRADGIIWVFFYIYYTWYLVVLVGGAILLGGLFIFAS